MESLPLLPGYSFPNCDFTSKDYKLTQKLKFLNGFRMICDNFSADDLCNAKFEYDPSLTYGHRKAKTSHDHNRFVPHWVLFERKTLRFDAYFRQGIFGSALEHFRIRRVNIFYYLDDDTMQIIEPRCPNAGFSQGKLVKRSKIPMPDKDGRPYHWKNLNVGMDLGIYGVIYRVIGCDGFTREFLTSQGIDVGEPESLPPDPYLQMRAQQEREAKAGIPSATDHSLINDKRFKFLEYDGMILTFDAIWNDNHYKIRYFLADDTIQVSEVKRPREKSGGLLLKRTKLPKNWKDLPATYPGAYLETSEEEIREYYSPSDLKVGETIFIFGRRFFLYDCDLFTRRYYSQMLRIDQPERITLPDESDNLCIKSSPSNDNEKHQQAKDLIRKLYNFPKRLRYTLAIDVVHPEDQDREFVLEYSLSDGAIRISEIEIRNSGRKGGCFLNSIRVPKPDGSEYYSPEDFYIGNKLNIFGHWFIVTGTEPFVYKYMCANPQKFNGKLIDNVKKYLIDQKLIEDDDCCKENYEKCQDNKDNDYPKESNVKFEDNKDDLGDCCCKEGECNCS